MRAISGQLLARRVGDFYQSSGMSKVATVNHFAQEGYSRRTIYCIIKRFVETGSVEYAENLGRKPTLCTDRNIERLKAFFVENPTASYSQAAAKFRMSKTTVAKCCQRGGIQSRKRQKAPKYVKNQDSRCRTAASLILRKAAPKHGNVVVIMDDETYVFKEPDQTANSSFYKKVEGQTVQNSVRFKPTQKFAEKYLAWQAISSDGRVSRLYIQEGTMNGQIYMKKCLKEILVPWIRAEFSNIKVLFWPDLASAHYVQKVVDYLEAEEIQFVRKDENAPNLPQGRPIERLWALCKREYSKLSKKPQDLRAFRRQWIRISSKQVQKSGASLFRNFRKKLATVRKDGPYGPLKLKN